MPLRRLRNRVCPRQAKTSLNSHLWLQIWGPLFTILFTYSDKNYMEKEIAERYDMYISDIRKISSKQNLEKVKEERKYKINTI